VMYHLWPDMLGDDIVTGQADAIAAW
jgi:hypothetical protein